MMKIQPMPAAFWNPITMKEEALKYGLVTHCELWLGMALNNNSPTTRYIQFARRKIKKEFHESLELQHNQERDEDRLFPREEQFVVAEEEYTTAPKLRDNELHEVFLAIDELIAEINDPQRDYQEVQCRLEPQQQQQQRERPSSSSSSPLFLKDYFCPEEKNLPANETIPLDEYARYLIDLQESVSRLLVKQYMFCCGRLGILVFVVD